MKSNNKTKLYCYVDETGQDGLQKFFLVSVVVTDQVKKDDLENQLKEIEISTGKKKSIFYSMYPDGKGYTHLTSLSVAKAVLAKEENNYSVTVIIDGLTKKDTEKVRTDLKQLKVKYDNIRGMKDEQSVFLRLADCFAGFIRDYIQKQSYAQVLFKKLKEKEIVVEV